jgi:hypothetical protein
MTVKKTELQLREDRKRKSALYDHPSTRKALAERDAGRTKGDEVRKRIAEEKGAFGHAVHKESVQLTHRQRVERERHEETSRPSPEMKTRHEKELANQERDHAARRSEMNARHRRELAAVED